MMKKTIQHATIMLLSVTIIMLSIGYAVFSTPMSLATPVTSPKSIWNVSFANIKKLDTTNVLEDVRPTLTNNTTSVSFSANLKVGDVYEFLVDIQNMGTIDAELASYTLVGTKGNEAVLNTSSGLSYTSDSLKYSVTYEDGSPLKVTDTILSKNKRKIKVSVAIVKTENSIEELAENYVFALNLNYIPTSV